MKSKNYNIEEALDAVEIVFSDEKLLSEFRKQYATEKDLIIAVIKNDMIKKSAVNFITKLAKNSRLDKLADVLSCDDYSEIKTSLKALESQAEIDDTLMADYVDGVQMIEQFEFTFTVRDLLKHIS